jgi:hypothetical protein
MAASPPRCPMRASRSRFDRGIVYLSSWPGKAVQRTASLPLAYVPAIHVFIASRKLDVDARDKPGHDGGLCCAQHTPLLQTPNTRPPSRDALAPELCKILRLEKQRAQGKPGARCTRSRACSVESTRVSHHRSTGTPGLPCAMVLAAYFALSPVTGLVCHRRLAGTSAALDASVGASGPHDFAVRFWRRRRRRHQRPSHSYPRP